MQAENNNKEEILSNIKIVTQGIIEDIGVNNSFFILEKYRKRSTFYNRRHNQFL